MKNIYVLKFHILSFAFFGLFSYHFSAVADDDIYLVMFESPICEWCEAWHEEIGGIYPKTKEGCIAPLRRINIQDKRPEYLRKIKNTRYTPTFVLIKNGEEVDRIVGYPGEDFFWGLLGQSLNKLTINEKVREKCV